MGEPLRIFVNGIVGVFLGIGVLYLCMNLLAWMVRRLPKGDK